MNVAGLANLLRSGKFTLLQRLGRMLNPFYRACFISALASSGLFSRLASGPASLESLAKSLALKSSQHEALAAWLQVGVVLGELREEPHGYCLADKLAGKLAGPEHDPEVALLEEVVSLHYELIRQLPVRLQQGTPFTLADQDGELVARSSRILEPLVNVALDDVIPKSGKIKLLDVGCGSGSYLRHACARNPELEAVGVELQPAVADLARRHLVEWGLADRAAIVTGDIRTLAPEAAFEVVTAHNNIYYFPELERPGFLALLHRFTKPGGRLLLTTGCRGGGVTMAVLNLWGAATAGCGPLPTPAEMVAHLQRAGFSRVKAKKLYPFEEFYAFVGSA